MVKKLNIVVVAFLEAKTKQISITKTNKLTIKNKMRHTGYNYDI